MTVAAKERSSQGGRPVPERLFESGSRSLEDVLAAVSERLMTRGTGTCLVCGGTLVVDEDAGGARCTACASCLDQ